jgi:hypothetical protein
VRIICAILLNDAAGSSRRSAEFEVYGLCSRKFFCIPFSFLVSG